MAAKKRTEGIEVAAHDSLAKELADSMQKMDIEVYTGNEQDAPTDLRDWISTGSSLLDLAISNRPHAGVPVGRIIELSGLEGSGKSLIAAHMIANVQREGGVGVLIDTEMAVDESFFRAIGVDWNNLQKIYENRTEKVFEAIEKIVERVRAKLGNSRKVIIVVDSVAGLSTVKESEGGYEKGGYGTEKPYLLSLAMRKITKLIGMQKVLLVFTNQLRYNLQPMSHEKWITPGGKAVPFHSSLRVRLQLAGKITKGDVVVGVKVLAKIIKNRFGPPYREVTFDVYFDRGIDDVTSWIDFMKKHEIVSGGQGGYYKFIDSNGEEHAFRSSSWKEFVAANPTVFEEMYTRISETLIMKYSSQNVTTLDDGGATVTATTELGED